MTAIEGSSSPAAGRPAPLPALVADIGGTNARFAIVEADGALGPVRSNRGAGFRNFEEAAQAYLAGRDAAPPRSAVLALAGVTSGDRIRLTNSPWVIEPRRVAAALRLEEVIVLNDFEALALSLPDLSAVDIEQIGGGRVRADGTRLALGPGTGLGAGAVLSVGERWVPVRGEGGHLDLGPRSERDRVIWPFLERIGGRVSGEQVLSGAGILRLYRAVAAADGAVPRWSTQEEVTAAALAGTDRQAAETLELFAVYLGRYAGDLALVFLPEGGVYLGGGIAVRIAPFLRLGGFRDGFVDKAPHRAVMDALPTALITRADPAIGGMAAFLRRPDRFALDLGGRRWTAA